MIAIFLLITARGIFEKPVGPFVISIAACLAVAALAYVFQLDMMLRENVEEKKHK